MGDEGVRAFEKFATEQKFVGSDRDFSPSWGSGFKKRARLPRSGERQDGRSEKSDKPPERRHSRGRRREREKRSPASRSRRRAPRRHFGAERAKSPRHVKTVGMASLLTPFLTARQRVLRVGKWS